MERGKIRFALCLAAAPLVVGYLGMAWSRDLTEWLPLGNLGVFFVVAVVAIEACAIVLADADLKKPWALHRALAQGGRMLLYAIPLGLAILTAVMAAGSADCAAISLQQAEGGQRWLMFHDPFNLMACGIYFVAVLACAGQSSFAQERRSPFRDVANALLFLLCAMQTTLWLGAWYDPFGWVAQLEASSRSGPAIVDWTNALLADGIGVLLFVVKAFVVMRVHIFVRRMLPRLRSVQVMRMGWRIFIPWACGNVIAAGTYLWLVEPMADWQRMVQMVLAIAGLAGMVCLAVYMGIAQVKTRAVASGSL